MNLFPYILGPVWVLDVTLTSDGHTIAAWRCKMGGEPQQTVYDAAAVAKGVAVVTVSGHGTIVKPADSQLAARCATTGRPSCGVNTTAGSPSCGASGCKEC